MTNNNNSNSNNNKRPAKLEHTIVKRMRGGVDDDDEDYEGEAEEAAQMFLDEHEHDDDDDDIVQEEASDEAAALSFDEGAVRDTALSYKDLTDAQREYWSRPAVVPFDPQERDINLQWLDIDMISAERPLTRNPNPNKPVVGSKVGPVPVIRLYGVSEQGISATLFIHGFTPYGYFACPSSFDGADPSHLGALQTYLNEKLRAAVPKSSHRSRGSNDGYSNGQQQQQQQHQYCLGVKYIDDRQSILGYQSSHSHFVKVYVAMPTYIPTLVRIMKEGLELPGVPGISDCQPFECNVPFVLRFMIDREITGAGWLSLPRGTYTMRKEAQKKTHCQFEIDISYPDIVARKAEGEWSKIAPLRVLSVDIECQGRKGHFPEAEQDPVIQIASCLSVYGNQQPAVKNIFTLKGCLPIVGAQVISSDTEADMLLKWRTFLQASDADIITGYNVQNFDIPYLLDRAEALAKQNKALVNKLAAFKLWGRVKGQPAKMRDSTFQSAAYGKRNNIETTIDGRVIFDMLPYMQRNHKLSSYTLNGVCAKFLGQQKEDVHHSIISDLQNGGDEDRHRLAVYCLKDALLPQMLMDKLSVLVNYIEMARVRIFDY